jgi:hypothetical protein
LLPGDSTTAALAANVQIRHGRRMTVSDSARTDPASLDDAILKVLTDAGGKTVSPPEIAVAIAAGGEWHGLLAPIRRSAVGLAQHGKIIIYRKGKPVDPEDFRGVYRLGLPRHD